MGFREISLFIISAVAFFFLWSYADNQKRAEHLAPYQKRIVELNRPRILDFCSKSCGPCRDFEPTWIQAKTKYGDRADFFQIEWEGEDPDRLIYAYNVHSLPTILFLDRHGKEVAREVGWPQEQFTQQLEATIAR